ncbi:MAG: RluA family pseudouridine synthase [Chlamydiae bacterium]|nr:RluA family pseudouridine synthase [Chlamydiota bacterium]
MRKKTELLHFKVQEGEHGLTLLAFLKKKCTAISSTKALKRAIESKECLVNGRVEFFSTYKLVKGDTVELRSIVANTDEQSQGEIIFEDDYLLIINKPAGVVSDAVGISQLIGYKSGVLSLVHRLDKDTSGLLMLAKTGPMLNAMKDLFSKKEVHKYYLALVDGSFTKKMGVIENFLGKKGSYHGQTIYGSVDQEHGERAITHWRSLEKGLRCSLLVLEPKTGRTHQLRVHLKEMGHPILGDYQYCKNFSCQIMPSRQMLHAWGLTFIHPMTKKEVCVSGSLADDFITLADQLKVNLNQLLQPSFFQDLIKKMVK